MWLWNLEYRANHVFKVKASTIKPVKVVHMLDRNNKATTNNKYTV